MAVVHTWPLASAPSTLSRNDNADTVLHEWTLAWVAHQIVRDPVHLFDANIFYPEHDVLAYSDHMLVQSLMAAPLLWAGATPVLAYNVLLMAGLALTGWTTALAMRRWTGSWLAGILSGSLMAFNALTLTRLPQLQDQHLEFFPLALVALDGVLARPTVWAALRLSGWFVLQALTCGYLLVFSSISLVVATLVRPEPWRRLRYVWPYLALAAALAIVLLVPFLLPYRTVSREQGLTRSFADVFQYSASWSDYLATGGRLHFAWWSGRFFKADALFPGLVGLALALVAVASGVAMTDVRARMALAFGVVAVAFSFGPRFPLYEALYYLFPLMKGIRGAVRFGQFFLAAIAILAGFGLVAVQGRLRNGRFAVAAALVVIANIEALRAPLGYRPYVPPSAVYSRLRNTGNAIVVCFPIGPRGALQLNAPYMLASTLFWKPILNGYSGFAPASYFQHLLALGSFPDAGSIQYLRNIGVTHVVVDGDRMRADRLIALGSVPELSLWVAEGPVRIYTLR